MESHLSGLLSSLSRKRLQTALDLLAELADMDAVPLATPQRAAPITQDESTQLNRILDLLHKRFAEPLRVRDLCAVGNISERSLHRSNFNRQFRTARRMTPKEFRRHYVKHGRMPELDKVDLTKRSPSLEREKRREAIYRLTAN